MRLGTRRRAGITLAIVALVLLAIQLVVPPLVREPMARMMERSANARLDGYRLTMSAVDVSPLRFRARMRDVVLQDDDGSEPPLLRAPAADAGLGLVGFGFRVWLAIRDPLMELDEPRRRAAAEADLVGQLLAIGPRSVQALRRYHASLGTIDVGDAEVRWLAPAGAVSLHDVAVSLENVARDPGRVDDPFTIDVRAKTPQEGTIRVTGQRALFASEPAPWIMRIALDRVALAGLAPLAERARLDVRRGVLTARGRVRSTVESLDVELMNVALSDADLAWRHTAATWTAERRALPRLTAGPRAVRVAARRVTIRRSTFAVEDANDAPPYRLFVVVDRATLRSPPADAGGESSTMTLAARPMGTGAVDVDGRFRRDAGGPEVDLQLVARNVALPAFNEALRANGALPLEAGRFAMAIEARVRDGRIAGYAKPAFTGVEVAEQQDAGVARELAKKVVDAVSELLDNERGDVATRITLSGTLPDPNVSVWEAIVGVLRNAFVEAIVPEFERVVG
jgi:hypothetical protein